MHHGQSLTGRGSKAFPIVETTPGFAKLTLLSRHMCLGFNANFLFRGQVGEIHHFTQNDMLVNPSQVQRGLKDLSQPRWGRVFTGSRLPIPCPWLVHCTNILHPRDRNHHATWFHPQPTRLGIVIRARRLPCQLFTPILFLFLFLVLLVAK